MTDYDPTLWVNNEAPALSADNLNKMESGIDTAHDEIDALDARVDALEVAPSGLTLIEEIVVGAGGLANLDFTDIPTDFRHLQLRMLLRSERAVARTVLYARFNGDSSAVYGYRHHGIGNAVATGGNGNGVTGAEIAQIPGSTAPANNPAVVNLDIYHYQNTTWNKYCQSQFSMLEEANDHWLAIGTAVWGNTSAIDQITILDPTPADIAEGSIASLYGLV